MAIPSNYIDKITKGTDSRMISPAADMVRVDNDNFEGADLNEVLDEVAQDISEAGKVKTVSVNNGTPAQPDSNGNVNIQVQTGSTISPADTAPQMDGTANVGSSAKYAREDHVHPHDSSKQNTLTFDNAPTASSTNPVTSGGVKTYVDGKVSITGITTSQDGTFTISLSDGNSYTVNLNHVHPQYQPLLTAGANITIATNPQTGNLEISASGGGGPMSGYVQSTGVANIVVCASEADYSNISQKDSSTLYLIKETNA